MPEHLRQWLSVYETARQTGESVGEVRRRCQRGELGAARIAGEWHCDAEEVASHAAELATTRRDW
jgi:hypothetical protein